MAPPILPAEIPYQRKKLKKYYEREDGFVVSKMVVDPFELAPDTVRMVAKQVWKKLKTDEETVARIERQLEKEYRAQQYRYYKGKDLSEKNHKQVPRSDGERKVTTKRGGEDKMSEISPPNITGFSELFQDDGQVNNSLMKENVNRAMRKQVHKIHGKMHEGEKREPEDSDVVQLPREGGGGSNSMSSFQKKNSKKNPTSGDTSIYTSNLEPIQEEKKRKKDKSSRRREAEASDRRKEPLSDRSIEERSERKDQKEDEKRERPSSKSKLDKTNKLSASFRSGSVAFKAQKGISPYRLYAQEEIKKMQRQR